MDQLLELTERTDGGLNASPAKREQIAALVEELEAYCPRNPLRSPLLYGDYEVRWEAGVSGFAGGGMQLCVRCPPIVHAEPM